MVQKNLFKTYFPWLLLAPFAFILDLLSRQYPYLTETYYSLGINKICIQTLSFITGLFPFSCLELFVLLFSLYWLFYIIKIIYATIKTQSHWRYLWGNFILKILATLSVFYCAFILLWGLNYNRPLLSERLALVPNSYSLTDLEDLYSYLIANCNNLREETLENSDGTMTLGNAGIASTYKNVFYRAPLGYASLIQNTPLNALPLGLDGHYGLPKPILTSRAMNYTGITGIYFPLTGEANVNTTTLDAFIPSTTMHEMAHQRGYTQEDECNFISFLSCRAHPDVDFQYSGYFLALIHTRNTLIKLNDSNIASLDATLSPKVLLDINAQRQFVKEHEGIMQHVATSINDTYLKVNGITDGEQSYGRMVDLLLAYYMHYLK